MVNGVPPYKVAFEIRKDDCGVASPSNSVRPKAGLKARRRRAVKRAWQLLLYSTGMLAWAKRRLAAEGSVVVLTFHRVLKDPARTHSPQGMVVSEESFEGLARYVAECCEAVSVTEGPRAKDAKQGKVRVAFTFDDAWADNASIAIPIARKYGIPVTIFVCPGKLGMPFPFWPERVAALCEAAERAGSADRVEELVAVGVDGSQTGSRRMAGGAAETAIEHLKSLPAPKREELISRFSAEFGEHANLSESEDATMTWDDVRALAADGVTFGSHTLTHEILSQIPLREAEQELAASKRAIERALEKECSLLAYPNGDCSNEVRDLAPKVGYRLGFLNDGGAWTHNCDSFLIPRLNIWEGNLAGPSGRFSRISFDYDIFWKAYRAS